MKHFQKAYLRPFPGLNVFVFSSGGQVIFKKELVTVTSYFAEKKNLVTVTNLKK